MVLENILGAIGRTPIVKFNRIGADLNCDLYGKCEYLSAGGSVKDRIGLNMIETAEEEGRIKPGDTLIEHLREYRYWNGASSSGKRLSNDYYNARKNE